MRRMSYLLIIARMAFCGLSATPELHEDRFVLQSFSAGDREDLSAPLDGRLLHESALSVALVCQDDLVISDRTIPYEDIFPYNYWVNYSNDTITIQDRRYEKVALELPAPNIIRPIVRLPQAKGILYASGGGGIRLVMPKMSELSVLVAGVDTHRAGLAAADISPLGTHAVLGYADGVIVRWDLHTGATRKLFSESSSDHIRSVSYHPSGQYFVVGHAGNRVCIRDADSCAVLRMMQVDPSPVFAACMPNPDVSMSTLENVCFSRDGDGLRIKHAGDGQEYHYMLGNDESRAILRDKLRLIDHVAAGYLLRRKQCYPEDYQLIGRVIEGASPKVQQLLHQLFIKKA